MRKYKKMILPACPKCKRTLMRTDSGLVCFHCWDSKILPFAIEKERTLFPIDEEELNDKYRIVCRGAIVAGNEIARALRKMRKIEDREQREKERMEHENSDV